MDLEQPPGMNARSPVVVSKPGPSRRKFFVLRASWGAVGGLLLAGGLLSSVSRALPEGPSGKPEPKVSAQAVPAKKMPTVASLDRLPEPDYLSEQARATLRRRMERHGQDMVQLLLSMTMLQHDVARQAAQRIAAEPTVDRPAVGGEDELGAALPERFFTLQLQLRSRAKAIAEDARKRDDAALGKAFGQLAETCVQCHSAYLRPPPK